MNGKANVVFGFFYLAITAVLGPLVLVPGKGENMQAFFAADRAVDEIRRSGDDAPAQGIAPAVVAITDFLKGANALHFKASAAHAHGNLEALLNVVAGVVLMSLAIPWAFKAVLSGLFIAGAVFHSGVLYLAAVFGLSAVAPLSIIGAVFIVAALILSGAASVIGIKKAGCC